MNFSGYYIAKVFLFGERMNSIFNKLNVFSGSASKVFQLPKKTVAQKVTVEYKSKR